MKKGDRDASTLRRVRVEMDTDLDYGCYGEGRMLPKDPLPTAKKRGRENHGKGSYRMASTFLGIKNKKYKPPFQERNGAGWTGLAWRILVLIIEPGRNSASVFR